MKKLNIANIFAVRSTFWPDFYIHSAGPTRIDPKQVSQQLPSEVTFDPPDCRASASGQTLPSGLTGNMAALLAEGEGNRFIAIAVETSDPCRWTRPSLKNASTSRLAVRTSTALPRRPSHSPERSTITSLTWATISRWSPRIR